LLLRTSAFPTGLTLASAHHQEKRRSSRYREEAMRVATTYSTAAGGTLTGETIEVGKYSMANGTGADPRAG
jgi:hypothetical protein